MNFRDKLKYLKNSVISKKWFTLIEIIVVITVMTILSSVWIVAINYVSDDDLIKTYNDDVQDRAQELYSKSVISKWLPVWTKFVKLVCNSTTTPKNFFAYTCDSSNVCTQVFFPISNSSWVNYDSIESRRWWLSKCASKKWATETIQPKIFEYIQTEFPYWVFIKLTDDGNMVGDDIDAVVFYWASWAKEKKEDLILK
jgi:hypothetical protein